MVLVDMLDEYFLKEMEYEAIENGEKPVLTKLPALVLRDVIKKLDVQSVKNFRGTCGRLLTLTPSPYEQLTAIHIMIDRRGIGVLLRTGDKTQKTIRIPQSENTWENMLLFNWDFIFRQRKTPLKFFSIECHGYTGQPDVSLLYKIFRQILKSLPPILAEIVYFDVSDQNDVLSVLPHIDPKHLKAINLFGTVKEGVDRGFAMDKLYELEQWKCAEELEIWSIPRLDANVDSAPFAHFSYIYISGYREVLEYRGVKRREKCFIPGKLIENSEEVQEDFGDWPYPW